MKMCAAFASKGYYMLQNNRKRQSSHSELLDDELQLQAAHLQLFSKVTNSTQPRCCVENSSPRVQHEIRLRFIHTMLEKGWLLTDFFIKTALLLYFCQSSSSGSVCCSITAHLLLPPVTTNVSKSTRTKIITSTSNLHLLFNSSASLEEYLHVLHGENSTLAEQQLLCVDWLLIKQEAYLLLQMHVRQLKITSEMFPV